ncbi:MAG: hypothetical protein AB7N80_11420 [Bdellovibrionales bacterium]
MKLGVGILIFFMSGVAWGVSSQDDALLTMQDSAGQSWVVQTRLEYIEDGPDQLLCRFVENKLLHAQRVERQIEALREKLLRSGGKLSGPDLTEMQNLEQRRQNAYEFLAKPAPLMAARWRLPELSGELLQRLEQEKVKMELTSYALLWRGQGDSFLMPQGAAVMSFTKSDKVLTLILMGSVASYCSRRPTLLQIIF